MSNILIIGAGSMGTAFSFPCSDKNHNVTILGTRLEDDFIDEISSKKFHPSLGVIIPNSVKFKRFDKLKEELKKKIDLLVIAVSSKGIEWISSELGKELKKKVSILVLTKGLSVHKKNYEILAHKLKRILKKNGVKKIDITAAGGPCLAKGLANRIHTSVVFANSSIKKKKKIAKLVSTNYYHVFSSSDVVGVEVCAAIKNIFSMAIGASEGLSNNTSTKEVKKNNYLNTAASLLQQSIHEMKFFTESLKGKKETVMGLAGIGDLYVSADGGRNSKMGKFLGNGLTFQKAKKLYMSRDTVEGADLVFEIGSKIKEDFDAKNMPLMNAVIDTIYHETPLIIKWNNFK